MENTSQATAQRLRALAAAMTTQIEDKLYTQHDTRRLTRRRLEMIDRAERQGLHLHTIQAALTVLADGHDQGTLPSCLAHLTTRAAVERLLCEATDSATRTALLALLPVTAGQPTLAQRIARLERELVCYACLAFSQPHPLLQNVCSISLP